MNRQVDGVKSELALFAPRVVQTSIVNSTEEEIRPISAITDNNPVIEYVIKGSDEYLDPANIWLFVECKVANADGSPLEADARVTPVNLLLHSLFSKVDVELGDRLISTSQNTYAYRCYIESLLNYNPDFQQSYMTSEMWYKDTHGHFEETNPEGDNEGLTERYEWFQRSRKVEMMGRLHIDITHQERLLLNRVDMRIKLRRSPDAFSLMSGTDNASEKIIITNASLFVRRVKVSDQVREEYIKTLTNPSYTALYPIQRTDVKVLNIPNGSRHVTLDNVYMGQMPRRLVLGMVDDDAFSGIYTKNPFNFKHNHLTSLSLNIAGESIPSKPLTFDFDVVEGVNYLRGYINLFKELGLVYTASGNSITRSEFPHGYTLFAFDLTADQSLEHMTPLKNGNLNINLNFANGVNSVVLIAYAVFDNVIEIDGHRNVMIDY